MAEIIRKVTPVQGGRIISLVVVEDGKVVKYRHILSMDGWRRDEWIRIEHSEREPSHFHIRRRMKFVGGGVPIKEMMALLRLAEEAVGVVGGGED